MSSFNELMQKYVNSDYEVLVDLAKQALVHVMPVCKAVDPENSGVFMAVSIFLSAIGADGKLTVLEANFLKDVLGLNDATIDKMIAMYDSRMVELVDKFADDINDDTKANVIMLVATAAAVDEKISREETALIKKLFA